MRLIALTLFLMLLCFTSLPAQQPAFTEFYICAGGGLLPERYHPVVLELPDGDLVCAWSEGSGAQSLDRSIRVSRKTTAGSVWSPPVTAANHVGYPDDYPALLSPADGSLKLIFATLYAEKRKAPPEDDLDAWHLRYIESDDSGISWGKPFFQIPESDLTPSGNPFALSGESLLLPLFDIMEKRTRMLLSEDRGSYWKLLPDVDALDGFLCNGIVTTGPECLTAALSPAPDSGGEKYIWFASSADNGMSWSKPEISELRNPGGSVAILRLENGHLVAAFNDHPLWLTPLTVAVSTDGGRSWTHKRNIETGQWDNRAPCLIQSRDGRIHLVYVSRNIHLKHASFTEDWITENQ
jgi:hypothetical protein